MLEKKAVNITVMDLRRVRGAFTDYFVICSGTSDTQVDAISESVEHTVETTIGQAVAHREGKVNREWILLDYIDVVVHVFKQEKRKFFAIEDLWGDARITHINPDTQS
jgi:ribosome-associated protein